MTMRTNRRSSCSAPPPPSRHCPARPAGALFADADAQADALLNRTAETFLKLYPETATSLGIDKDKRAQLKHQLTDRSPRGSARSSRISARRSPISPSSTPRR
jgi:uncharacterized protein (DUF885 family)